ncbi:hypothetical protein BpHYR1_032296 [Brachionus plicatilis]|uniref:Uncharacterized protein n=1 Tax=Brachionus plicatilis TaxID=10195 RepID=A0A3M7Q5D9_BRAPC|nr:hypothetical protein BpHYR1_032296 [Brachionus plicatilis]
MFVEYLTCKISSIISANVNLSSDRIIPYSSSPRIIPFLNHIISDLGTPTALQLNTTSSPFCLLNFVILFETKNAGAFCGTGLLRVSIGLLFCIDSVVEFIFSTTTLIDLLN